MNTWSAEFMFKRRIFLVAGITVLSLAPLLLAEAPQKPCTREEAMQAADDTDHLDNWNAVYRSFKRFSQCDDGGIAEGYSDDVGKLLADPLAPDKNPKRDLGEKRQGPWNVENTQAYLDWTPWENGEQLPGGKSVESAKWLGPCIADDNHKDAALILHDDGWWSFTCFHPQCEMSHKVFMAHWEEAKEEKYPYPGSRPETWDSSASFEVEGADWTPPEEEKIELKSFNLTDSGNTERPIHRSGHLFRYCPEQDWFCWDGKRWVPDSKGKVYRAALRAVRLIPEEIKLLPESSEDVATEILKWTKQSEGSGHINSMVDMGTWMGRAASIGEFDRDQWLFNCDNGTVDLRSGEFRPHQQEDMITNISPIAYDPKAACPLWLQFLDEVMLGNQELIGFLQRAAGYSLTGSTVAHCVFMLHGKGNNGKTTFLEVLRHVIGTYGQAAAMETFMARTQEGIPNDLAALRNARFVSAIETEESRRLNESKIKLITGGAPYRRVFCTGSSSISFLNSKSGSPRIICRLSVEQTRVSGAGLDWFRLSCMCRTVRWTRSWWKSSSPRLQAY
jgi:hypothetical protein